MQADTLPELGSAVGVESLSAAAGRLFVALYGRRPSSVGDEHAKKRAVHETAQNGIQIADKRQVQLALGPLMTPYTTFCSTGPRV